MRYTKEECIEGHADAREPEMRMLWIFRLHMIRMWPTRNDSEAARKSVRDNLRAQRACVTSHRLLEEAQ